MAQRYDTYKDSGVQWLGVIPSHWVCVPFKSMFELGKGLSITKDNLVEKGIKVVSYGQIHSKSNVFTSIIPSLYRFVDSSYLEYKQCLANKEDFLIADTSEDIEGSGNFVRVECQDNIFAGYHTILAKNKRPDCGKYISYLMQSKKWKMQIWIQVHGVKLYSITKGILSSTKFILPPLSEQHSIVSYLDDKCAKIDEWIEKKEKEVELLGEMKQRVIADAVTRGLNPNVKMKPATNSFFGMIPNHWEEIKMKYLFNERSEKNHPEEISLCATQTYGVIPQKLYCSYGYRVVEVSKGFELLKFVKEGDFVIHLRSFQGGIEYAYYQGIISPAYTILEPRDKRNTMYFKYLFKSYNYIQLLKTCVTGIREGQNINYSLLGKKHIPVPPISEQQEIVSYINDKTSKIDTLVAKVTKEIEHLKEYKQRLISDVVTGQIKVC